MKEGRTRLNLRGRVVATTVVSMALTAAVLVGASYAVQGLYRDSHHAAYLQGGADLWRGLIQNERTRMAGEFSALTRNRKLTAALFKGTGEKVREAVGPTYTRLSGQGTVDDLAVVSKKGEALYSSYDSARPGALDVVEQALDQQERVQGLERDATGRLVNAVAIPLYDRADFVGIGVYLKGLGEVAEQFKAASGRDAAVVNGEGDVQTATRELRFSPATLGGAADTAVYEYRSVDGKDIAVAATPLTGHDGAVVGRLITTEDRTEHVSSINQTKLGAAAIALAVVAVLLVSVWWVFTRAFAVLPQLVERLEAMGRGDFSRPLAAPKRSDELGRLADAYNEMRAQVANMVGGVRGAAEQVAHSVEQSNESVEATQQGAQRQQSELSQIATAMNETTSTIQEVANNTTNASQAAEQADEAAKNGRQVVATVTERFDALAHQVEEAAGVVGQLQQDSEQVGQVLGIINDIAEQTNLLSLNAAIEAARAGEDGRGFAVVADEVRTLAQRTQKSVTEIREIIDRLQNRANDATGVMEKSQSEAQQSVEHAREAGTALERIVEAVGTIGDQTQQIAAATKQQTQATEQIDQNVTTVASVAEDTASAAARLAEASGAIREQSENLRQLVAQMKTEA